MKIFLTESSNRTLLGSSSIDKFKLLNFKFNFTFLFFFISAILKKLKAETIVFGCYIFCFKCNQKGNFRRGFGEEKIIHFKTLCLFQTQGTLLFFGCHLSNQVLQLVGMSEQWVLLPTACFLRNRQIIQNRLN